MPKAFLIIATTFFLTIVTSCSLAPKPPIARSSHYSIEKFGDVRTDEFHWLQDRTSQEVIDYLIAENNYTETIMEPTLTVQQSLYNEMKNRLIEEDESVPVFQNGYYYYIRFEKDKEFPINCRRKGKMDAPEEIILDENEAAAGHEFCMIASLDISPDNRILAYGIDTLGLRKYAILFKDLETGLLLDSKISNSTGSVAWANDNQTVFYAQKNKSSNQNRILKHNLMSQNSKNDTAVYIEPDSRFNVDVFTSKSMDYILIKSISSSTTEYRFLDSKRPNDDFKLFQARIPNIEYHIFPANNKFYIRTNWGAQNYRIMEASPANTSIKFWKEIVAHNSDVFIMDIDVFRDFMVILERKNAITRTRIHKWSTGEEHYIDFGEEVYTTLPYANPEFATNNYLYYYTSLTTPNTTFEYNMLSRERRILRQPESVASYNPKDYITKRLWATSADSVKIPISILCKKGIELNGKNPMLIYAYGAYGYSENPVFNPSVISLIDRGFIYAIAHVRGGEELGKKWHNQGRLLNKKNTFCDFVSCTEFLIDQKFTSPDLIIAKGNSAGGLLMGVISNTHPELYKAIIANMPCFDVVSSILDTTLKLPPYEYEEWGNPDDSACYKYIKSYSPYDQVKPQAYPNMLITTSYNHNYFESTKWAAKLRANKTNDNLVLLKVSMNTIDNTHPKRNKQLEDRAFEYAFILHILNMD